jgi:hypothetical protein
MKFGEFKVSDENTINAFLEVHSEEISKDGDFYGPDRVSMSPVAAARSSVWRLFDFDSRTER